MRGGVGLVVSLMSPLKPKLDALLKMSSRFEMDTGEIRSKCSAR